MSNFFATPSALLGWLKSVSSEYRVVAPKTTGTLVLFKPWTTEELGACKDPSGLLKRTNMSAKEVVTPKCETLYEIKGTKDNEDLSKIHQELIASTDSTATLLFGGRPCDVTGPYGGARI